MAGKPPPGLFITAADTAVGKTYVAAMIARALVDSGRTVGVYKPAASGCRVDDDGCLISDDALALWQAAGEPGEFDRVCPQRFAAPLAPHLAARREGKRVDPDLLRGGIDYWRDRSEIVLVEGAGGLMSPLDDEGYVADLAYDLGYPLIVVAANRIGVIGQTLQTLIVAATFRRGLPIGGVVLNTPSPELRDDPSRADNADELAARAVPPVLAQVNWQATRFTPAVDWMQIASSAR